MGTIEAAIFDVDGVLLASPHERAWRDALQGFADPSRFTTEMYQAHVAGKPRLVGALAALEQLGVPHAAERVAVYAERKQKCLESIIAAGGVAAFPDALRFVQAVLAAGLRLAVASSSKNANQMLKLVVLESGQRLFDVFGANVCGRDLPRGKPDPAIFLLAAAELGVAPERCFVVEDAAVGIQAAHAGGMLALGVARAHDEGLLRAKAADLVVTGLDEVDVDQLANGHLCSHPKLTGTGE
jgi:beta-phosphoglucomutase